MQFSMPSMRRSRHPLVRAFSLLLGVALIGILLVFGLVVAGVLLVGGGLLLTWRQWTRGRQINQAAPSSPHQPQVLEGEFVVIQQGRPVAH